MAILKFRGEQSNFPQNTVLHKTNLIGIMDLILRCFIAGLGAGIAYTIINGVFFVAGVLPSTLTHYSAKLVMPPGTPITTLALTMGGIADIAASFTGAILIELIFRWTGKDLFWFKGLIVGGVLWLVHVSFIPAIVPRVFETLPPSMVVASFILSVLWGLIVGVILRYLPEPY